MFQVGMIVMYGTQLCKITEMEERSFFSGQTPRLYYTLAPVDREADAAYVPADQAQTKLRPVLSKSEIELLRKETNESALAWIEDRQVRNREYTQILHSGDPAQILLLIRCLLTKKAEYAASKKKLTASDEKLLSTAEKMIDEEFSYVLDIEKESLSDYFRDPESIES